ncbi:B12-binding domain-containing radical SAM protein [Chloroflexota bacterium]
MKTWICNTMCNFYAPLLGTARLYAYTKKQGHDVHLKDYNQDTYFTLLSRDYLEPTLEKTQHSIDTIFRNRFFRKDLGSIILQSSNNTMKQLVAKGMLLDTLWYKFVKNTNIFGKSIFGILSSKVTVDNVILALLSEKNFVLSEIERSRKILDEGFFSLEPDDFIANFQTLLCGKALIDAAYFPAQFDFGLGFHGTAFSLRTSDIIRSLEDERYNFLIPYYRNKVISELNEERPDLVGISITCVFEIIPALTLAHMIKKADPKIHVVLGGVLTTELAHRIVKNLPLWNSFDSLILGPGEVAFNELIEHIDKKSDLSGVPNIIYKEKETIRKSEKVHEFDISEACTPEFVSVRLKSSLPLEASSGCYWGKCIFCYYPKAGIADLDTQYQRKNVRKMELVLKDVRELKDRYDPINIGFTDSSMHPKRIEAIAEENLRTKRPVKFSALFRLENEFKSKAFCRKLADGGFMGGYVGLESGSQRVNDIINKGIDINDTNIIIKNFNDTGLLLHVFSIIGIPGETREDAMMTYDFFKRCHRRLKLDWAIYYLAVLEQSPIAQRASELGIEVTPPPDDYLIDVMRYRTEKGLSQEESSGLAIGFSEKLKRYTHPLNQIMDVESMVLFLLAQSAKGIPPDKVKKPELRI